MAKRVFFTFHYADIFRVNVVRNHWVTKKNQSSAGFFDWSIWEENKKTSDLALKRMINDAIKSTSTSTVLIGSETFQRTWVRYEIFKSIERFNKLIGVHINCINTPHEKAKARGQNPFSYLGLQISNDGRTAVPKVLGTRWMECSKIDLLRFEGGTFNEKYRGKFVTLDHFARIYDWEIDNGYDSFAEWIE